MNYSRKSYRYLLVAQANPDDKICNYKLVSQNHFPNDPDDPNIKAIRFLVPDDMKLKQKKGEYYSITEDQRTLRKLDAHLVVKINGRWKENPFHTTLDEVQPCNVHELMVRNHLYITPFGYLEESRFKFFVDVYCERCVRDDGTHKYTTYWEFEKQWKNWKNEHKKMGSK